MRIAYLAITLMTSLAVGYAAMLDFAGAESVKQVADRVHVSRRWMVPLGSLLAAGSLGLLLGLAVPWLGTAAATGLVLYFAGAVGAHLHARDRSLGGAAFFLVLTACALLVGVAYRGVG